VPDGFYKVLIKELANLGFTYERQAKGHTANGILKKAGSSKKF
jgi:hypothetical protein